MVRGIIAALFMASFFATAASAGPKMEIRLAAAVTLTRNNFQHNQPFDSNVESAAYDIIWRGQVFGSSFQHSGPIVLAAKGHTDNRYKIGGGSCTGTLTLAPEYAVLNPVIWSRSGNLVRMSITLPHLAANTGLHAMIMDKNQPEQSVCRVANGGLFSSVCYTPAPVDCYSLDGTIVPGFPTPADAVRLTRFQAHSQDAYFEFNEDSPSTSIPFSYTATERVYAHDGVQTEFIKIVWAGYLTISTGYSNGTPPPVDPYSLLGFDPGAISGPPNDPTPPENPFQGPKDPGFDVREMNSWIKELGAAAQSLLNSVQGLFGGSAAPAQLAAVQHSTAIGTYDHDSGVVVLSSLRAPPSSGLLQIRQKSLSRKKAKGFVLNVPKSAPKTTLTAGAQVPLPIVVDKATRRALERGQSLVVFLSVRASSTDRKKQVLKRFKFSLPSRK